eukprot:jgi/Ulvmu1/2781/UM140_0011.1
MAVLRYPSACHTTKPPFRSRSAPRSPRSPRPAAANASSAAASSSEQPDASEATGSSAGTESALNPAVPPPRPVWCLSAPSAEESLRRISDELRAYGASNATSAVNAILRRDPLARVARNADLRALVTTLLDLRAAAASGTDAAAAAFPGGSRTWARAPLELSLFHGEVRRIHRDLLKTPVELRHIVAARNAAAAAAGGLTAPGSATAAAADGSPRRNLPPWAATAAKLLLLPQLGRALRTLRSALRPQMLFADFSLWNLRTIQRFADELPHDAELQAALLRRLNSAGRQAETVQRVSSGAYASSPACEVEYLRAMVSTGGLEHFRGDGPPPPGVPHGNLARFLEEVRLRLVGDKVGTAAAPDAAGAASSSGSPVLAAAALAGAEEAQPLHVRLQNVPAAAPNPVVAALRGVVSFFATIIIIMTLWVIGAAAEGSLQARGALGPTTGGPGGPAADKGAQSHAPKEYNKDTMPESSVKTFADVKGCDEAKAELQEVVEYLKNPQRFVRLGAKLPKGVLLSGPPGTGKTLLARAVAGEAGVPFFYRAGSEFEEMFVGVGSRRVRSLFQAAKAKTPCIIFIDEIDAVGSNRRSWENHSRKTLNQMLTEMDGFEENSGVIVMAATNLPEVLDPALTRPGRFDRRITINAPDVRGRQEIAEYYLASKPVSDDVSAAVLARKTPGFSGAQIANMINEAALAGAKCGADRIDSAMLDEARDKVMMGRERTLTRTETSIKHTAYHEAGHALVALFTPGADPLHKATINPRGDALGLTWQIPPSDEYSRSLTQLRASIDVAMGGQVAETLVFGQDNVGAGATSDLKHATGLARHMVCDCGFSEVIGPMTVDDASAPTTRQAADKEVMALLHSAKERVHELLRRRVAELHAVAAALIRDETLDHDQISRICAGVGSAAAADSGAMDDPDPLLDAAPLPA